MQSLPVHEHGMFVICLDLPWFLPAIFSHFWSVALPSVKLILTAFVFYAVWMELHWLDFIWGGVFLLIFRNTIGFCILILCPVTVPNSLVILSFFGCAAQLEGCSPTRDWTWAVAVKAPNPSPGELLTTRLPGNSL